MAENLFSKHRPLDFDSVVGHAVIVNELKKRVADKNIPQAVLIIGKTGTGKNCLEKILSKSIFCNHPVNNNPCNVCDQCQTVIQERISNYYYLFNASNIGIDEMRQIEEIANKKILSTVQKKVIVIDELQEISNSKAQKNILKILEKPQKDVTFILMAMDDSKISSAIKNRCVVYKLKDLTYEDIAKHLLFICSKENIKIDTSEKANALIAIAQNSDGSMRTAISYLERCIYSELWTPELVLNELGITTNETIGTFINQILLSDISIFENEITKEILDKIRWILNLHYKSLNGVNIPTYLKSNISSIKVNDISKVGQTIDSLNKFTYLPYITQELIDFTLIDILRKNKDATNQIATEVKPEVKVRERIRK